MPARKRKVSYPTPTTSRRPPADASGAADRGRRAAVVIEPEAGRGQAGLAIGDRVRIAGTGLYAGEIAVIQRFAGSAIPAAVVTTESGSSRQVRTIDLEPIKAE